MGACREYQVQVIPIGEIKIIGKIVDGVLKYEQGEGGKALAYVVTPAYVNYFYVLQWRVREQEAEIRKLRLIIEGGKKR
jgi:hypothetical protein